MTSPMMVEAGALAEVAPYMRGRGWSGAVLIVDRFTLSAAGGKLRGLLEDGGVGCSVCVLPEDALGQVLADERAIVHTLLHIPSDAAGLALVAVGAGTIHDVARFAAATRGVPFISVPTAASVDGFTSLGAPLIIQGFKRTVDAVAPVALFADTGVLTAAPRRLTAAGFGDMLAKYTSLADWRFSHLIGGEPYDAELAAETAAALRDCVERADEIAALSEGGIRTLLDSLIRSGLVMRKLGTSHPASGGEHHLSHYWEMRHLSAGKRQELHGRKTGLAAVYIAGLYHSFIARFDGGPGELAQHVASRELAERVQTHWSELREAVGRIPQPQELKRLLELTGNEPDRIELDAELVRDGLREAYRVRDRYTLLRFINENGLLEQLTT